jgi:predicted outer membrane protein
MENHIWKKCTTASVGAVALAVLSLPLSAQNTPARSTTTGTDQRQDTGVLSPADDQATPWRQEDTDFMKRAYQASFVQVDMANLALQNASSEELKQYAQEVLNDFTKAGEELRAIAGPATPQNGMTGQALSEHDYQSRSKYERKQYPYLRNNPYLLKEMENFNVGGSGLGTSRATTGTAVSRPTRPRNPTNSRPATAGIGAGSGTPVGTGTGSLGAGIADSSPNQMLHTTAVVNGNTRDNGNAFGRREERSDSRGGISGPRPAAGLTLSEELPGHYLTRKDKLIFLSRAEFDREYMKTAKNYHAELRDMLQLQVSAGGERQARQWAEKYLSVMQEYQPLMLNTGQSKTSKTKARSNGW